MKQFEIGHTYYDTWACDSDSISKIKIVGRSSHFVSFERNGKTRRAKIYTDSNGEYIMPDHYSMACVYRAERELLQEAPEAPTAPAITDYTISPDLIAFSLLKAVAGTAKQADFLATIITNSNGITECR